ncbi:hypothetical protein [Halonatronum saccharophilum]|uniref:hypothetical protein n=1 Tax=Halonatronum saccharophilum TaxID=150060 RepID=UPI00047FD6E0|nr:hypothetical protein [Halonatronum saccharophilum]
MKAKVWTKVNGQWYKPGEELPTSKKGGTTPEADDKGDSFKLSDLTIEEIRPLIDECDDLEQLKKWFEEEKAGSKRKGVLSSLKDKKTELEGE